MLFSRLLLSLGGTPKDRLSTLAAITLFFGGSITVLAESGFLGGRWGALGLALSTISSSAIGLLTGRDSQHPGRSAD
jgi:hypothetical protein